MNTFVGNLKAQLEEAGAVFEKRNEGGRFYWACVLEGQDVATHAQLGPCIRKAAQELGENV